MLIDASRSALLIVDVQERLLPTVSDPDGVVRGCGLLLEAARRLDVPFIVSEQYPKGLGPTVTPLNDMVPAWSVCEKLHFSCVGDPTLRQRLGRLGRPQIVIGGIEAHVCVLQTALGLGEQGLQPIVVEDAVSSRLESSRATALARLRANGVEIVTVEMVLFEWLNRAGTDAFRDLSKLVR